MKRIIHLLLFLPLLCFGQSPQGVNYQAVAFDSDGFEISNQEIGVRVSILEGSAFGTFSFVEEHSVTTSQQGLFSLIIGQGDNVGGTAATLSDIAWGTNTYFLKIELDIENNGSYMDFGTQQFMSVPYALYAESSGALGPEGPQGPPGEPADSVDYDSLANIISIDSTFLATVTGGIGGCDFNYPHDISGSIITERVEPSLSYTVPSGKVFYLMNVYTYGSDLEVSLPNGSFGRINATSGKPIILSSNQVIKTDQNYGNINGFLCDEKIDIQCVTERVEPSLSYTVPSGKVFYLMNVYTYGSDLEVSLPNGSFGRINATSGKPIILSSNQVIKTDQNYGNINGYLVDDNYFANCGGGSSSNESSSLDSTMVADMIASVSNEQSLSFGNPITNIQQNINYFTEALEDGFIGGNINCGSQGGSFSVWEDTTASSLYSYSINQSQSTMLMPVKKGQYWKSSHNCVNVSFFIPLESNLSPSNDSDSENMLAEIQEQINALDSITTLFEYKLELMHRPIQESLDAGIPIYDLLSVGISRDEIYGSNYQGGFIFYIDPTGHNGLIASFEQSIYLEWGCHNQNVPNSDNTQVGYGFQNTLAIVEHGCETEDGGITAAQFTLDYQSNGYTDWYLPSIDELDLALTCICDNSIQTHTASSFWSSNEDSYNNAFMRYTGCPIPTENLGNPSDNKDGYRYALPIRSF